MTLSKHQHKSPILKVESLSIYTVEFLVIPWNA
jgi:hypothetical protein